MDSAAGLLTAGAAFVTALAGAVVLLIRELRRNPRKGDRIVSLMNLLSRTRDWLQGVGLWSDMPEGLRDDIQSVLDERQHGRSSRSGDYEPRRKADEDE